MSSQPISAGGAARQALGRPIKGPRALTDDWSRFWHLTYNIARNEFKLKFFGSALGYAWQVMRPLLLFGVLYVFFVVIGHVGKGGQPGEANYGVQLLGSIVLFTFFPWHKHLQRDQSVLQCQLFFNVGGAFA